MRLSGPLTSFMLAIVLAGCAGHHPRAGAPNPEIPTVSAQPSPKLAAPTTAAAVVILFEAQPVRLLHGETTRLVWDAKGSTEVTINGIPFAAQGNLEIAPKKDSVYHLIARFADGRMEQAFATVNVASIGGSTNAGGNWGGEMDKGPVHSTRDDGLPDRVASVPHPSPTPQGARPAGDESSQNQGKGSGHVKKSAKGHSAKPNRSPAGDTSGNQRGGTLDAVGTTKGHSAQPNRSPAGSGEKAVRKYGLGLTGAADEDQLTAKHITGGNAKAAAPGSALDNLPEAKAVVSHPDPMQVDREETVTVSVSLDTKSNLDQQASAAMIKAGQKMENTALKVKASPFMRVDIQESPHFKVRYLGPDDQRIQSVGKDPANWPFSVTPVDAGDWDLHITVTNYASENDGAGRILLQQNETIHVKVLPFMEMARRYVVAHWNWNWLWTTIILPLWAYLRRRFKKKEPEDDDRASVAEMPKKETRARGA